MTGMREIESHPSHADEARSRSSRLTAQTALESEGARPPAGTLRTLSVTATGASHAETLSGSQDAFVVRSLLGRPDVVGATVADGHGHPQYWRSDIGAHLAAATLVDELERVAGAASGRSALQLDELMGDRIAAALVRTWREECGRHLREHPMVPADYASMAEVLSPDELQHATLLPLLLYGTTALGFCLSPEWLLVGGVGDGEILHVDSLGKATCSLPPSGALFANVTNSLCENDPTANWRSAVVPRASAEACPVLVLAATDGFTGAFASGALEAAVERLTDVLVTRDHEALERELWEQVGEAQRCVGDDVTVVVAYDEPAIRRLSSFVRRADARTVPVAAAVVDAPAAPVTGEETPS